MLVEPEEVWLIVSEQIGVNQEDCTFTWYFREDTKALMLAFTQEETPMAQF